MRSTTFKELPLCLHVVSNRLSGDPTFALGLIPSNIYMVRVAIGFLCLRPEGCRRHYVFGLSVRPSVRPYTLDLVNTIPGEPLDGF